MPPLSPELFGYAGMVTGISFLVPQIWKSLRTKSVEDISWGMLALIFLNCLFWFSYGVYLSSVPIILTNSLAALVLLLQVVLKVRYRKSS